jgi:hypothetical protein
MDPMVSFAPGPKPVTPWLDSVPEPVHEGVYKREYPGGPFSCWAQGCWYGDASSPDDAAAQRQPSRYQRLRWRGLAERTGGPCQLCRGLGVTDRGVDEETGEDLIEPCSDC